MPCIESRRNANAHHAPARSALGRSGWAAALLTLVLAGCSFSPRVPLPPMPPPAPGPSPLPPPSGAQRPADAPPPARPGRPAPPPAAVSLPPPRYSAHWLEFRRQAAERMVAATPAGSYMGVPPEPLLAIPVLEIELNRDGSVRHIQVMRRPGQAEDTIQLAIDAVHRGAPYGPVSHLPRPWRFTEVFLFDDARRFKPRTLD